MVTKKTLLSLIVILLALIIVGIFYLSSQESEDSGPVINNFKECVAQGYPITESYPRQCRLPNGKTFFEEVSLVPIVVFEPSPNARVSSPLLLKGRAAVFENSVSYRLLEEDGSVLREGFTMAASPDVGVPGEFEVEVPYSQPKGESGLLEVFEISAKDGEEINKVNIPVIFSQ